MDKLKVIGKIETGFSQKFGIPRQSGLVTTALGRITFEKEYRDPKFVEGLDQFDYIWVIFGFSANKTSDNATVRPPRLGGKRHMGVFATRAPYRPNNIGLSLLHIEEISFDENRGTIIKVSGVDMLDGTPIYDIKPYLPYVESHPDARGGFGGQVFGRTEVEVDFPECYLSIVPPENRTAIIDILKQDPRAAYDKAECREFRLCYAGFDIIFTASDNKIEVTGVIEL